MLTTKLDYKIDYKKLDSDYDFYCLKLSSDNKKNISRDLNKFNENYNFPYNVISCGMRVFCVPKGTFNLIKSDYYNISPVNNIRELSEDVILNFIAKVSIRFKKTDRYSLGQNLFYFIDFSDSKNKDFIMGVEPVIKNGILELNRSNYRLVKKDSKLYKDRYYHFSTTMDKGIPIIKNCLDGSYINKGYGKSNKTVQIDLFNYKACSTEDMDKTKLAAAYYFLNMINDSKYANVSFRNLKTIHQKSFKDMQFKNNLLKNMISDKIKSSNGIYINQHINNNEVSSIFKKAILDYIPELDESFINTDNKIKNQGGFEIHYDKKYYDDKESDPYNKIISTAKQSITFVETILSGKLIKYDKKGKMEFPTLLVKCLTELCIKLDIKNNTKPTFSSYEPIIGYGHCTINKSPFLFKYSDTDNEINVLPHDLDDDFVDSLQINEYYIKNENVRILDMDECVIPDIFLAYEILNKIEGFRDLEITKKEFLKFIKTVSHEKVLDRFKEKEKDSSQEIYDFKYIKSLFSNISGEQANDLFDSFYNCFGVYPKQDIRFGYNGVNVIESSKKITLLENDFYTIGLKSDPKNASCLQPLFKINHCQSDLSDIKKIELIERLHGHYYIRTNSSTTKPFFMKYIREAVKNNFL